MLINLLGNWLIIQQQTIIICMTHTKKSHQQSTQGVRKAALSNIQDKAVHCIAYNIQHTTIISGSLNAASSHYNIPLETVLTEDSSVGLEQMETPIS